MDKERLLMKKTVQVSFCCLASILLGYMLLTIVYMFPSARIFDHIKPYKGYIEKLVSPHLIDSYQISKLDTYAESIMLQEAIISAEAAELPAYKAALANYYYQNDPTPRDSITKMINGGELEKIGYGRYWHGYLVTLKTLLCFLTYPQIQWCNMFVQLFLLMLICVQLGKRGSEVFLFPFAVVFFWIQAPYLSLNLQFSTVLFVLLFQLNIILALDKGNKTNKFYDFFFLFSGIVVAYLDFLTYPVVTLGIPLVLWLMIHKPENVWNSIKTLIRFSVFWVIGYTVMWAGKWVLDYLFNSHEIIDDVIFQIRTRLGVTNGLTAISPLLVFRTVLSRPTKTLPIFICAGIAVYIVYIMVKNGFVFSKSRFTACIPYLFVALYPFIWMSVMKNHCLEHNYFVYRILAVSWFSLISMITVFQKNNGNNRG